MGIRKINGQTLASEVLPKDLMAGGNLNVYGTGYGWSESKSNSGSTALSTAKIQLNTGTTATSTAARYAILFGLQFTTNRAFINWDKKLYLMFTVTRGTSEAETVGYVQLKQTTALTALDAKGIGIKITNFAITGVSYGSSGDETVVGASIPNNEAVRVVVEHNPDVPEMNLYLDNVLTGTQSTAAKLPSGNAGGQSYLMFSLYNGGTGGTDANAELLNPMVWQEL